LQLAVLRALLLLRDQFSLVVVLQRQPCKLEAEHSLQLRDDHAR
jgi:hypothetical protein